MREHDSEKLLNSEKKPRGKIYLDRAHTVSMQIWRLFIKSSNRSKKQLLIKKSENTLTIWAISVP